MSGDTTTLVVINLPSGVDGDALVGRFGSVFRSATNGGGGPSDAPPSISPGAVRFTEKQWTVEGVETSVRIAFVDVDGGPKRAATIMSAYNGSKWYGNKITVQRARQRYYLHALEEEWREQDDKEKEQAQMSRRGATDADNDVATASTAPLRIPRPGGRGTLTVYIDKQERQKKVRMGQYQNLLKDRRGLHAMSAALGRGPVRKSDVSTPALHPHPTASHRAVASVARRPTAAGGAARVCPPPRKKRSRLDEEDGELRGDSDEEYDTEEGEKRHGEEMHTEEAIARERSQHLGILQKLGIVPEQIREKAERPRGGERGHEGARRARDGGDAGGTEEEAADQRQGVISAIEEANEFEMNIGMQGFESLEMQLSRMRRDRSRA